MLLFPSSRLLCNLQLTLSANCPRSEEGSKNQELCEILALYFFQKLLEAEVEVSVSGIQYSDLGLDSSYLCPMTTAMVMAREPALETYLDHHSHCCLGGALGCRASKAASLAILQQHGKLPLTLVAKISRMSCDVCLKATNPNFSTPHPPPISSFQCALTWPMAIHDYTLLLIGSHILYFHTLCPLVCC